MSEPATSSDRSFFDSISGVSARSVQRSLPLVRNAPKPTGVLDVGYGHDAWLLKFISLSVGDAVGVDDDYVAPETLIIPISDPRPVVSASASA